MLTVAEDVLHRFAEERRKRGVHTPLGSGDQRRDLRDLQGRPAAEGRGGEAADNIVGGPEHSTLANDAFPAREFDFMLSNPAVRQELEDRPRTDGAARRGCAITAS